MVAKVSRSVSSLVFMGLDWGVADGMTTLRYDTTVMLGLLYKYPR